MPDEWRLPLAAISRRTQSSIFNRWHAELAARLPQRPDLTYLCTSWDEANCPLELVPMLESRSRLEWSQNGRKEAAASLQEVCAALLVDDQFYTLCPAGRAVWIYGWESRRQMLWSSGSWQLFPYAPVGWSEA